MLYIITIFASSPERVRATLRLCMTIVDMVCQLTVFFWIFVKRPVSLCVIISNKGG